MVRLLIGPSRSGRAKAVDDLLVEGWGRTLLIVPTQQYAEQRLRRILESSGKAGAWGRPVVTFQDFSSTLLRENFVTIPRITTVDQHFLIRRTLDELKRRYSFDALGEGVYSEGFVNHVQGIIAHLKQAAIDPDEFRSRVFARGDASAMDAAVADIYEAYQTALRENDVLDLQGQYWMARLVCEGGHEKPHLFERIDTLLLDDFDDFTPSEFALLEATLPHVNSLVFGLNYDPHPEAEELYALTKDTADRIRSRFDAKVEVFDQTAPNTYCEFASIKIFHHHPQQETEALSADLEFMECHGFMHEIESVGRRIKSLILDEGVSPKRIAVVFRKLSDTADALRGVFNEFGIPVDVAQEILLTESSVAGFVLDLIEAIQDWERDSVAEVLASPWFAHKNGSDTRYADEARALVRHAQIIGGYDQWRARLGRLRDRLDEGGARDIESLLHRVPHAREACDELLRGIEYLREIDERFPREDTAEGFALKLDELIATLGIGETMQTFAEASVRSFETAALESFKGLLGILRQWSRGDGAKVARTELVHRLRRAFGTSKVKTPRTRSGVACLDLQSVRRLDFDHVFLGGLNEGLVPCPPPLNAIYSEQDRNRLRDAGIDLEGNWKHTNREVSLFHHIFDVAKTRLVLSWHTVSRGGRDAVPSGYIQELRDLFPDVAVNRPGSQLDVIAPELHLAATRRDLQNRLFAVTKASEIAGNKHFESLLKGVQIENGRHDASPFGIFDGSLDEEENLDFLREHYGESHSFSVDQIETYASCPFRFFMERVLRIEEVETPDEVFDARVRGRILHGVLETFHRSFPGTAAADIPVADAEDAMNRIVTEHFAKNVRRSSNVPEGVTAVERQRMKNGLLRYLETERSLDERRWIPSHFEVSFGSVRGESQDTLSTAEPFVLETTEGAVRFSGQIDRIDLTDGETRIVDYKSSRTPEQKDIKQGLSIQLALYALAVERYLASDRRCAEAIYLVPGQKKRLEGLHKGKKTDGWDERKEIMFETLRRSIEGIRAGRFYPTTREGICEHCPRERVCRHERARVLRKVSGG